MRIKLKKNPAGITGIPAVRLTFTCQAGAFDASGRLTADNGIALVVMHTRDNASDDILSSLRLSPSEARTVAAMLLGNADDADRMLADNVAEAKAKG